MEDRSNKTIICSVLFLDIVEYSKKGVGGQISLKERFNAYLSEAIHDVPVTDRIILDTGDGAAVNFLGDVESALTAALRLRASLLKEDTDVDPQLLVRIGINLGPVRLVRDINGQPNIVGDGINVAQRVMGFAEPSQILVSRSYFDAVSRLSDQYTGMFHYQGSRTDKHVREHEIYAIGYPGDQTTKSMPAVENEALPSGKVGAIGRFLATPGAVAEVIRRTDAKQRVIFAAIAIAAVLAGILTMKPGKVDVPAAVPVAETMVASEVKPASSVADKVAEGKLAADKPAADKPLLNKEPNKDEKLAAEKKAAEKAAAEKLAAEKKAKQTAQVQHKADLATVKKQVAAEKAAEAKKTVATETEADKAEPVKQTLLIVSCKDDAQLFVDSANKGKITSGSLKIATTPGKHKLILTHPTFGIYTQEVKLDAGETENVKPKVCN